VPPAARARLVVLASGSGTTLQALLDASADPEFGADVVAVGADRDEAAALVRAGTRATFVVRPNDHPDRSDWDQALADTIALHRPDWVVSAGFMRLFGPAVLTAYRHRIINTHPALLPAFPGAHAVRDALAYGVKVTGCSVHLVDAGVDTGPVLAQAAVPVEPADDESSLHERIKSVERELFVDTVAALVAHGCTVTGRKVTIP
jgi:formyltetrahydrofolate-dependent phosphoribosylglycinamide formyltransferase